MPSPEQSPHGGKPRLQPYFIRSIHWEKRPAGKVYKAGKDGDYQAEIEWVQVMQLADPRTGQETAVVIDPRHPQSRDHLKLAQEVLEGRTGGLAPVNMLVRETDSLTPTGQHIEDSSFLRVEEMESPVPSRANAKVIVDGKQVGERTAAMHKWLDEVATFECRDLCATYLDRMEADPAMAEWNEIQAAGRAKHAAYLKTEGKLSNAQAIANQEERSAKEVRDPADPASVREAAADRKILAARRALTQEECEHEAARFTPTRDDFVSGRHAARDGLHDANSVWDTMRGPVPVTWAEQGLFFAQQALVERFQQQMQSIEMTDPDGNTLTDPAGSALRVDLVSHVDHNLVAEGHNPVGQPARDPELTRIVVNEKAGRVATETLAGLLKCRGAQVRGNALAANLGHEHSPHSDALRVIKEAFAAEALAGKPRKPGTEGAHYLGVLGNRASQYGRQAAARLKLETDKAIRMPEEKKPKEEDQGEPTNWGKHAGTALGHMRTLGGMAHEAGAHLEGTSFGL